MLSGEIPKTRTQSAWNQVLQAAGEVPVRSGRQLCRGRVFNICQMTDECKTWFFEPKMHKNGYIITH